MDVDGKKIAITGAGSGIGRAMAKRFADGGAKAIACIDLNLEGAQETAQMVGKQAQAWKLDVSDAAQMQSVIDAVDQQFGGIDLFCSNAGIAVMGEIETSDEDWARSIGVNLMSHIYAARILVPKMLKQGSGYLLNTASAAGLLTQVGSASYAVTKHGAVAFAEFLSIAYGDQGIGVSVLCPQAVRTAMTAGSEGGGVAGVDGMLEPEVVAEEVVHALREERFLVLPHPEVLEYMRRKTSDYDRWLSGMRRLRQQFV